MDVGMECSSNRYKRRSSFVHRRLSIHPDPGSPLETRCTEFDNINEEEEAKLTGYINKLKTEKEDWKNLLERLKKENLEFKQKAPGVIDHASSWELLTTHDKQFLQGQVDYVSLARLLDSTAEAVALRQKCTTATATKLVTLLQDCIQRNADLTSEVIRKSIHQFDELDLCCDDSTDDCQVISSDKSDFHEQRRA